MGHHVHHAILVTSSDCESIERAWQRAKETGAVVSDISDAKANGFRSFAVFPDGSKEGWQASDDGDAQRKQIVQYLRERDFDWIEVAFGGDYAEGRVVSAREEL